MSYEDSARRPFIHLVDGGIADNAGMRGVLEALETLEALHSAGHPTSLDRVRRIVVFMVNSVSSPKTRWDESEESPGALGILLKATGVPIDRYSYEAAELLKDTAARWQTMRRVRDALALAGVSAATITDALHVPDTDIYAIDVSFARLKDVAERDYLNELPTTLALPADAVDRLRAAARTVILASPEFDRLLKDANATIVSGAQPGSRAQRAD